MYSPGPELGQAVDDLVQSVEGTALAEASLQADGTWEVGQGGAQKGHCVAVFASS